MGLLAAALVCLTMMIPGVNYASILWWLGAGYFSVWIYKRRTGQRLTVRGGARMGWITGVLSLRAAHAAVHFHMLAIQQAGGLAVLKDRSPRSRRSAKHRGRSHQAAAESRRDPSVAGGDVRCHDADVHGRRRARRQAPE